MTIKDVSTIATIAEWQTLITGILAILAAFIGGHFITQQIQQTERLAKDREERELAAARSMLPMHLAYMIDHVRQQGKALMRLRRACGSTTGLSRDAFSHETYPAVQLVPPQTASFFENMVLKARSADRAKFAEILAEVQVSDSRLTDMRERYLEQNSSSISIITMSQLDSFILQLADIHARCESLFEYARPAKSLHEPNAAAKSTALHIMGFRDHEFPTVFAELNRRAEITAKKATKAMTETSPGGGPQLKSPIHRTPRLYSCSSAFDAPSRALQFCLQVCFVGFTHRPI